MKTSIIRQGQSEIGIVEHNDREFAAYGESVNGKSITAYHGPNFTLKSWGGKTILDCRCEVAAQWRGENGKEFALVFRLTSGRAIVGYSLGEGMLFRGEIVNESDEVELRRLARIEAEYWARIDQEDEEQLRQEEQSADIAQYLP